MTGLEAALADAARDDGPDTVALMRVLMEAATENEARTGLDAAIASAGDPAGAARLRRLRALWHCHPEAWRTVRTTIDGIAHRNHGGSPDEVLAYWAAAFDRLVAAAPEASVALYSLGSADVLDAVTDEIVGRMTEWGLVFPGATVLDLGCGIGRFLRALAPRVAHVTGLDISARMVAEACRRCGPLPNVSAERSTGRDLGGIGDGSMDLVLAADVFPYLVEAGGGLPAAHVAEAARVLRPGGAVLILNYAYRGDLAADRRDVAALASGAGFAVERLGSRDFTLWDGVAFLLRKPSL